MAISFGGALLMDGKWILSVFLSIGIFFVGVYSTTYEGDTIALQAIKSNFVDESGSLSNWEGDDPCGGGWTGVYCVAADYPSYLTASNSSHVTELRLLQLSLKGLLAPEIGNLTALKYLNVMWNQISGSIPSTIGQLQNLRFLLLSGNNFAGVLPQEVGLLQNLVRLQVDGNSLSGPVPDTFLLPNLPNILHIQMNNNSLNSSIPVGLATLSSLQYLLLDNNQLTGTLPVEIASMPNLVTIRLDNNDFDAGTSIPSEYGRIPQLVKLSLSNCNLNGGVPDFSGAVHLIALDLSHNFLSGSIPNVTMSANLTSLDFSYNNLSGNIPEILGSLPALQFLELKGNNFSGLIPSSLGTGQRFSDGSSTTILDFQDNSITGVASGSNLLTLPKQGNATSVWLFGNPFCSNSGSSVQKSSLCKPRDVSTVLGNGDVTYGPSSDQSACSACSSPDFLAPANQLGDCRCLSPITVLWRLDSPSFEIFDSNYRQQFSSYLASGLALSVNQVFIRQYVYQPGPRFLFTIFIFPTGSQFEEGEVSRIYSSLAMGDVPSSGLFGPYELVSFAPPSTVRKRKTSHGLAAAAIAGIVVGVLAFVVLKTTCMFYGLKTWLQRRSSWGGEKGDPMMSRRQSAIKRRSYSSIKVASVKEFTFAQIARATDNFSPDRVVGEGGYGKVYSGTLEDGQKVAIKRAEAGSFQGSKEFETEIQLLSRVHHRNLVSLIGYCNDEDEQVLVYEFIAYGNLLVHLSAAARVPLTFLTRLQIALDSARGIHYLHTQADPPIYHRDVKASNILLDEQFHAKVSDFGLSKLAPQPDLAGVVGHISTVVKGTPGYLDPEYFKTHRLTEKSDVYSFGVVLLVLVTGMQPITEGKNLVREVNTACTEGGLGKVVDFRIRGSYSHRAMEALTALALVCCRDNPDERPDISEVLARLEDLWKETYYDINSSKEDGDVGYSGDMRLDHTRSEDSYIEIDPSLPPSSASSTVWTSSGNQDSGTFKDQNSITIINPR